MCSIFVRPWSDFCGFFDINLKNIKITNIIAQTRPKQTPFANTIIFNSARIFFFSNYNRSKEVSKCTSSTVSIALTLNYFHISILYSISIYNIQKSKFAYICRRFSLCSDINKSKKIIFCCRICKPWTAQRPNYSCCSANCSQCFRIYNLWTWQHLDHNSYNASCFRYFHICITWISGCWSHNCNISNNFRCFRICKLWTWQRPNDWSGTFQRHISSCCCHLGCKYGKMYKSSGFQCFCIEGILWTLARLSCSYCSASCSRCCRICRPWMQLHQNCSFYIAIPWANTNFVII